MNENDINRILRADDNLREAVRRREQRQPPMPAGLNERLMLRIEEEVPANTPGRHRRIWPWIAAACVAAVMVVVTIWQTSQPYPAPQRENTAKSFPASQVDNTAKLFPAPQGDNTAKLFPAPQGEGIGVGSVIKTAGSEEKLLTPPLTPPLQGRGAAAHSKGVAVTHSMPPKGVVVKQRMETKNCMAVTQGMETKKGVEVTQKMETPESLIRDEAKTVLASSVKEEPELKPTVLTERDIPITRPENYRYTPEEIALLKKQANEAYIKWVQLELEIAKYNLEQMAQQ